MKTESATLHNVLTKSSTTRKKRLMFSFKNIKEYNEDSKINVVGFISSEYNIPNALTEVKDESILRETLYNVQLSYPLKQCLIRKNKSCLKEEKGQTEAQLMVGQLYNVVYSIHHDILSKNYVKVLTC